MFVVQNSFILEGRKVSLAERRRHNDWLMWSYDLMFANYYESKFAWRLTFSLDWFSCCLNSSAQRRLPDFTASTRLSDKLKMADAADDATVTRFSKWEEEYSIEDVDRLAFLRIMTSSRSLGCCRSKTRRITSRIGACQACLHQMFMFTDVCACEIRRREVNEACRCACLDGIAPSKVSTSDDACDIMTPFLSARSPWLCCLDRCPRPCIGRFREAFLLEWMRFVIFQQRSRERSQRTSGPILSRLCFTLCITVKVETRIAKQYKCQCCCSCKNYRGKGMEGENKVSLRRFLADEKIASS